MSFLTFVDPPNDTSRKILHVDMDAFYAAIEERENPDLKAHPLVIARHPKETQGRGVVTTANYKAREYGIHSAMPATQAYDLCPHAIFVPGRMDFYRQVSLEVRDIFSRYTDLVEPLSVDEAFLDVTYNKKNNPSASLLAGDIQRAIWRELSLTCSIGVSYNKFIAKLGSDFRKPAGMTVITPEDAHDFLMALPIEDFYGVGKKTVEKMHELKIFKGADLYEIPQDRLIDLFGKRGLALYQQIRGIDNRSVNPHRERKSLGRERTFSQPLATLEQIQSEFWKLTKMVKADLSQKSTHGKTITIKVRNARYETVTRQRKYLDYLDTDQVIYDKALVLFEELEINDLDIRLLGLTISDLAPFYFENITLPLNFSASQEDN